MTSWVKGKYSQYLPCKRIRQENNLGQETGAG